MMKNGTVNLMRVWLMMTRMVLGTRSTVRNWDSGRCGLNDK